MNNKPVAWMQTFTQVKDGVELVKHEVNIEQVGINDIPLYTHPSELTDEEINSIWAEMSEQCDEEFIDMKQFARAILRKAQEK